MEFSEQERKELLHLARQTIADYFKDQHLHYPENINNQKYLQKRGAFVTLKRNGELRGCIGYPLPIKPLYQAICDNALSAAFEDPRFPSLTKEELPEIIIEISVLTVPQKIDNPSQIKVGRDGIIISKGFRRGLLLPQVPVEQNWDLDTFLAYGCLKAGLPPEEWQKGVQIEIFQAEYFSENEPD